LGDNINTVQKDTKAAIAANNEVVLEVKEDKNKYMLM
jgi:hypothetical protein